MQSTVNYLSFNGWSVFHK